MSQPVSGYLYTRNVLLMDARRTVSGTASTTGLDVSQFKGNGVTILAYVDTVTASGNVTAAVEESDVVGSGYVAVTGATNAETAVGLTLLFIPNVSKRFIRITFTLNSGTSIAVTHFVYGQPGDATTSAGYTIAPQV